MKHNLRLKCMDDRMERALRARRRAAEANSFFANVESPLRAYWPFGLPVDAELPTASTSKAPVKNQPWSQERHEGRMAELQSFFDHLSEGTSTEAPFERVPVISTAPTSVQVNLNEEVITSHKGKGKAKETPDSDAEEEPSVSPAQVASSLSQITSIASRLETLVADFQFPAELDFSPSRSPSPAYSALDTDDVFALTYASTNAPLRAQEHALSLLLGDLDNVPSFGSRVVRDARRSVVARIEQALDELEKGVEERRGRARARKADPGTVTGPVERSSEPENLTSADLAPIQVPVIDEVPANVFVPALPVEALAPAASSPIEAIADPVVLDASIEVPAASIEIATAFVAEPCATSSASLPTASSEVSETLTAQEVSVPQEEEPEVPPVDEVSTVFVSEDAVIIEATNLTTHADLTQLSSPSATRPTPLPLDTSDSHSQNTLGVSLPVSIPDFETLTHADADISAEVADTTNEPASSAPVAAAASSFLGSDHEQIPSEDSDSESYSSVESPASSSPVSEAEGDTFLLL